jgi:hypothetical protein
VAGVSSTFTSTTIASDAVNTVAPAITGTRGGTLTATPGTWTGATSVSGQWYADGVATGNTTTSFTDSDTSKSLEYRETALPGNVVASGYRGASVDTGYVDNFDTYADGTRLAERYNSGSITNFVATATPHVAGWDAVGNVGSNPDTDSTGWVQQLRIFGGKVQQTYNNTSSGQSAIVRDFGSLGGIWDFTLSWGPKAATAQERPLLFSVNATSTGASPTFIRARCRFANFNNTIVLEGTGLTATTVNLPSDWVDGDVLRVKIDATGKLIYFFRNGTAVGNAGGYSLAAFTGVWTSKAGFQNCYTTNTPPPGENIASALSYNSLSSNNVTSAVINQQPGGSPWQKQIDITASVPAVEATGAQYKVETEAGQFVQGWTAMTLASGTATASCALGDHAFEGQKFRVLVRNVGGTVSTAWGLTAMNGYVLSQQMRLGMNSSWDRYWGNIISTRDVAAIAGYAAAGTLSVIPVTNSSNRHSIVPNGQSISNNYHHWGEDYSSSQAYPDAPVEGAGNTISSITFSGTTATVTTAAAHGLATGAPISVSGAVPSVYNVTNAIITVTGSTTFTYTMASTPASNATTPGKYYTIQREQTVFNGVQWLRTNNTPRTGVAPDPADPNGTTSGWVRTGYAHGSVVGVNAAGLPTKLPDDPNATIGWFPPWAFPSARYPFTLHCKTEPGVKWLLVESTGNCTMPPAQVNLAAGTFDLVYTGDANPLLKIDRSTPISSAFFISAVPSYEVGGPAPDVGVPYAGVDKISDYAPFYGHRNIHGDPVIEIFITTPTGAWTAANNVPAGGRSEWKSSCDLANQAGHKIIWVNVPDLADPTYIDAQAAYYRDHLNPGIIVYVELGNERWNFSYYSPTLLINRTKALDPADPAYSADGSSKHLLHAREQAAVVARWKAVWGAQANRVKGVLAWQTATSTATWAAMLNTDGNVYHNIGVIATAPYMNTDGSGKDIGSYTNTPQNIRDAVTANDQAAFNAAADTQMRSALTYEVGITKTLFDWLPGYSVSKGLSPNAIGLVSYEGSQHIIVNETNWNNGLGAGMGARASAMTTAYKQSATYAATHALYIDTMDQQCPHLMMLFDYAGGRTGDTWWGHMGRTGNVTDEPYATAKTKAEEYNV